MHHIPEGKLKGELLADYHKLNLKPKVLISYLRRPFVSKFTNNLRITLDYDLKATKITNGEFLDLATTNYVSPDLAVLEIKFNDFWNEKTFIEVMRTDIPADSLAAILKAFYAYKIGVYVNDWNYEAIGTLEGVLELHNLVKGKIQ